MMADLMDEHMRHDRPKHLAMFGPIVENGPAIEENHVGKASGMRNGLVMRQAHPLEEAQKIEFALGLQFVEHIVGRKLLDADDQFAAKPAEMLGKTGKGLLGQTLDRLDRGRFETGYFGQRNPVAVQKSTPSADIAPTVV